VHRGGGQHAVQRLAPLIPQGLRPTWPPQTAQLARPITSPDTAVEKFMAGATCRTRSLQCMR
jgi:hypothetical protein